MSPCRQLAVRTLWWRLSQQARVRQHASALERKKQKQRGWGMARGSSLKNDKFDYVEAAVTTSSLSTPTNDVGESPFSRDSLGDTVIHLDKVRRKYVLLLPLFLCLSLWSDTTAQHNQDGQHTLHTVHRKGEGLTKIKQPASSTGWDANVSWGNPRYTLDVETTPWSSWSQGHQKTGHHEKLAGTTWGANSDILKQVYTGAVRPVVEYASTIWDTASKTNKSKLDRVQNMGLRIILGAMRSTPIQQMEKTTDLQPLECRREYKAAIQGEKLKRLTSHPLHQKLQHGTKKRLKRKSFKHKLKNLQKENADLLEADPGKCEELTMSVWASRKSLPEVRTEIPGLAAKGTQAPELQKALTLEMIQSRYPKSTWTHVFTDGSAENAVRNRGSGAYIRRPDGTTSSLSIPAGDLSSNYRAEVHALKAATELLIEEDCNQQNIVLLSDSLSTLQSLTNGPTDFRTQQLHNSLRTLSDNNSSAPVGASTCWHCWKRDCRQTGKGSSKTPSTSLLHHIQRSQDPSETEAEISLEIKKQWIWPTERPD